MAIIRPAGYNERRCISRDVLGLYGYIVTIGTYSNDYLQSSILQKDDIIKAVKHCITKHPALGTIIHNAETEKSQLVRAHEIDLNRHIQFLNADSTENSTPDNFQSLLEIVHSEPPTDYESRPQWRLYILPVSSFTKANSCRFHLAFSSSHALADGASGFFFHTTLLEALQNVEALTYDASSLHKISDQVSQLPPALDKAAEFPISWSFLLGPLLNEFLPASIATALGFGKTNAEEIWHGAAARPEQPTPNPIARTMIRTASIPSETLGQVLRSCKRHNARLTGLLNHITAVALAESLQSRNQTFRSVKAATAIDLRRWIPVGRDCIANYVSGFSETIQVDLSHQSMSLGDWEAVRNTTDSLSKASGTLSDQPIALLKYLSDFRAWNLKNASKPAEVSFGMSNLGVFDGLSSQLNHGPGWHVHNMIFSQSGDLTGEPFNVNVASAKHGALNIVLSWWPGMLGVGDEEQFMQDVCASIVKRLETVANE